VAYLEKPIKEFFLNAFQIVIAENDISMRKTIDSDIGISCINEWLNTSYFLAFAIKHGTIMIIANYQYGRDFSMSSLNGFYEICRVFGKAIRDNDAIILICQISSQT
jgi:hypothetical protein